MNNDPQHTDDNPELRKLLKSLPKKTASPDFEMRLQQRIKEGKSVIPEAGFSEKEFSSFRIPTFAFSLMTLFVVGTISYYAFFRDTDIPKLPEQEMPVLNDRGVEQASSDKTVVPEEKEPDQVVDRDVRDAAKEKTQTSSEQIPVQQQVQQQSGPSQNRSLQQRTQPVESAAKEPAVNEAPQREVSLPAQQMAAPVQEEVRQEQQISVPEKNDNMDVRSIIPPAGNVATPPLLNKAVPQMKTSAQSPMYSFPEIDSAKIRDSIKADSLQKLLKLRRKDQKIRKPFN